MKELLLLILVIGFGAAAIKLYTRGTAQTKGAAAISPEEAKEKLTRGNVLLLDVRTQAEFASGHIEGAVCLANEEITTESPLPEDKETEIILYCRSGVRSKQAACKLEKMGYVNLYDLGAISNWPYGLVK